MRQFYKGGFLPDMTRREAALILGADGGSLASLGIVFGAGAAMVALRLCWAMACCRAVWCTKRSRLVVVIWCCGLSDDCRSAIACLLGAAGVRESAPEEKVKEAHRRIMIANHPDAGGSSFVAAKVRCEHCSGCCDSSVAGGGGGVVVVVCAQGCSWAKSLVHTDCRPYKQGLARALSAGELPGAVW